MNSIKTNILIACLVCCNLAAVLTSCSDDNDVPCIDSVWKNMAAEPVEQVSCAYPGQTICLRGSGFSDLKRIVVNGNKVDVMNTLIYDTDNSITFKIPSDVDTSVSPSTIKVVTAYGDTTYTGLLIKPTSEKPIVSSFSATTLSAGQTLVIKGKNLEGATAVYLPLCFDQKVKCEFDTTQENTATDLYVIIPADVNYAKGQCQVVMEKTDPVSDIVYTENAYSATTNFSN